jgi:hypothetical protein
MEFVRLISVLPNTAVNIYTPQSRTVTEGYERICKEVVVV